jgi:hypothetical protein
MLKLGRVWIGGMHVVRGLGGGKYRKVKVQLANLHAIYCDVGARILSEARRATQTTKAACWAV